MNNVELARTRARASILGEEADRLAGLEVRSTSQDARMGRLRAAASRLEHEVDAERSRRVDRILRGLAPLSEQLSSRVDADLHPLETTMDDLDELRGKRARAVAELAELAGQETLTGGQEQRFERLSRTVDNLDARIGPLEERARRLEHVRSLAENPANVIPGDGAVPVDGDGSAFSGRSVTVWRGRDPYAMTGNRAALFAADVTSRALSAVEQTRGLASDDGQRASVLVEQLGDPLARHVIVTGNPHYRTAFAKLVSGRGHELTPVEASAVAEARALSLSDAAGGFAVPFVLDSTIISTKNIRVSPIREISRVVPIVGDVWNGVSSAGVTASYAAEAAEVGDNSPTLAQPSIPVHKAHAFIPFSVEIGMDWAAIETELRRMFEEAKDDLEAEKFTLGSGTGEPTGIVTTLIGSASVVNSTTTDTFAVGDIYNVDEALPPRWRSRARWLGNRSIYNDVRQFGTSDSHALWERIGAGMPPKLLGYDAHEASAMDGVINATQDNYVLILGDFSSFVIAERVGMSVELVPHRSVPIGAPPGSAVCTAFGATGRIRPTTTPSEFST